nr:MAG TPA: ETC complex I subunit conserved region [Caudoviricetes sp.]
MPISKEIKQLKQVLFGGRKQHIKTFKTVEAAIKFANK